MFSTEDNYTHFKSFYDTEIAAGNLNQSEMEWVTKWLDCVKNNYGYFVYYTNETCQKYTPENENRKEGFQKSSEQKQFNGKVIILTDPFCFSSCELFVKALKMMPNTIHVGLPTNASTNYGDIRNVKIPSNLGRFSITQKVFFIMDGAALIPDMKLNFIPELEFQGKDSLKIQIEKMIEIGTL